MEDEDFLAAALADTSTDDEPPVKVEIVAEPTAETPKELLPETGELLLDTPAPEQPKQDERPPLAALLDERDKRKALEAELAQLRAAQPQIQMPDPYEDPEGFAAAQRSEVSQALYQQNLRWSEQFATVKHGEDTVKAAKDWGFAKCDSDPYFNAKVASSPDPVGFVVAEYKREEIASKVTPDEFAQFQAWKTAQGQLQQPGGQPPPPTTTSAIPPRSLASAPSAGSILTEPVQSDDEMFKEVIGKR